ncbi:MAG: tRNA lysidine(34) synthetase TilS [Neisseriaceae bacterium]|nr:tRNA lysidine(34) synthetase TilS [Neisseriaceae bacterium]
MANSTKINLIEAVCQSWSENCADHFSCEIALSGGLDSVVLLHLLCSIRHRFNINLSAIHVHHGLQKVADDWVVFCQKLCHQYQVPLRVEYVNVDSNSSLGIEGEARAQRYQKFSGSVATVIAMAHHLDDQIETFFLSLLRGGGVRGMSAMPVIRNFNHKTLWRPLLQFPRKQLEEYAKTHNLPYVQDPSNADTNYLRNWLRHQLLPQCDKRITSFQSHIESDIRSMQNALATIDEIAKNDLSDICPCDEVLNVSKWKELSLSRREEVLHQFIKKQVLGSVNTHLLQDISKHLFRQTKQHYWQLSAGNLYLQYDFLWFFCGTIPENCVQWRLAEKGLPESLIKKLHLRKVEPDDVLPTKIGHKNVIKLLQERKIPLFIRKHWQVLVDENDICRAVVNIRCDENESIDNGYIPAIPQLNRYLMELYS